MALFKSTFDEADMSTDYELVDKQTADLQKNLIQNQSKS